MAWQGDGTFQRTNGTNSGTETWQDDAAAGTKIRADRHDTHDQDLADGIAACITQNLESKPTADFAPNVDNTYDLGSSSLKWVNTYIAGDIVFDERADHAETPAAGKGQIWVKSDDPSSLQYTDDAGTDHRLGSILDTAKATTIGSTSTFSSLPAGLSKIYVMLNGVSSDGTENVKIELGTSGAWVQSGYVGYTIRTTDIGTNVENPTASIRLDTGTEAADAMTGFLILTLMDSSTDTWAWQGQFGKSNTRTSTTTGVVPLSATLSRIRLSANTDEFDAGSWNIRYE